MTIARSKWMNNTRGTHTVERVALPSPYDRALERGDRRIVRAARERFQLALEPRSRLELCTRREGLRGRRAREPGRDDGLERAGLRVHTTTAAERTERWKGNAGAPHLDLGDEVVCVLLRSAAVRLVDVLRDHARVWMDEGRIGLAQLRSRLPMTEEANTNLPQTAWRLLEDSPEHLAEMSFPPTSNACTVAGVSV